MFSLLLPHRTGSPWPDKATRDAGMQKVFGDPRMAPETNPMPFDGSRMIFGGFEMIVGP